MKKHTLIKVLVILAVLACLGTTIYLFHSGVISLTIPDPHAGGRGAIEILSATA